METTILKTTAARALVDQLIINGIDHVFCVPGESYLSVLDAFYEQKLQLTVCRNEGGAMILSCRIQGWTPYVSRSSSPVSRTN